MEQGVVIIAMNAPIYGHMAYNLVCSLKSEGLKTVVIANKGGLSGLNPIHRFILGDVMDTDQDNPFLMKLFAHEMSPFDETIQLDADCIKTPHGSVKKYFDTLKDYDVVVSNRGEKRESAWLNVDAVKKAHGISRWVDTASEFMYYKKNEASDIFFENAKLFYLKNTTNRTIGGYLPDEPALSFAIAKTGMEMPLPFRPTYWEGMDGYKKESKIHEYDILSMGGNRVSLRIRRIYDMWAKYYCSSLGVKNIEHQNKDREIKLNRRHI